MISRLRESLTLVLIALLPLHAMAVTVLTQAFEGSNQSPFVFIAIWKEVLLAILLLCTVIEIQFSRDERSDRRVWSMDVLDWCIVLAIVLGALVSIDFSAVTSFFPTHLSLDDQKFLVGFKYDFLPLVAFFVLRRVSWSSEFLRSASWVIIGIGAIISVFGLLALALPMAFFTELGYSDLHSLYLPHAPLAAFQMVEGTALRRIQSVMSGPNQFGLWLLIPFAAALQRSTQAFFRKRFLSAFLTFALVLLFATTIVLTYSRSAWIGAAVIVMLFLFFMMRLAVRRSLHRKAIIVAFVLSLFFVLFLGIRFSPAVFLRAQSLRGHMEKPVQAVAIIKENPLGLGLGTAGPASNHFSDTCVFFDLGADISWARKRTDICVFLGGVRKLPAGKVCECPLLTENWYLQWGVEMGYAGLLLCLLIVLLPLLAFRKISLFSVRAFPIIALLGLAIAGIFLHSFEDSAVAFTIWILLASAGLHIPDADVNA